VKGGPGDCCGALQYRTGDVEASGRLAYRTLDRFARSNALLVLSCCPTCPVQLGENVLPGFLTQRGGCEPLDRILRCLSRQTNILIDLCRI
jgi:Fe-S oxidoreductase